MAIPTSMDTTTISRFGGPDVLEHGPRAVPRIGLHQVLIEVAYAGVGTWDPQEREGLFAELTGSTPEFPHTLGGDGSGRVVAIDAGVQGFREGDLVYAVGAGFYAEYVVVDAAAVSLVPRDLSLDQAGAMPVVALTALQGLVDQLQVTTGHSVLINGAGGDVGLIAVQLAKNLGARVLAVASGNDGVDAALALGADAAVDGREVDLATAARDFAPQGLDAALSLLGGPTLDASVAAVREGGRLTYPLGVQPGPGARPGVHVSHFDLTTDAPEETGRKMGQLNELIAAGPFQVPISQTFPLAQAAAAHEALSTHRVGKVVLSVADVT